MMHGDIVKSTDKLISGVTKLVLVDPSAEIDGFYGGLLDTPFDYVLYTGEGREKGTRLCDIYRKGRGSSQVCIRTGYLLVREWKIYDPGSIMENIEKSLDILISRLEK